MGLLSDLALGGVQRLERGLGKRAALQTTLGLLDTLPDGPGRDEAWVRAIDLAGQLGDDRLDGLITRWASSSSRSKATSKRVRRLLGRWLADGRSDEARRLADAEQTRTQGRRSEASAAYAHGRALEQLREHAGALNSYARASRRGTKQPRLRRSAAARRVRLLQHMGRAEEAAIEASELLPLDEGTPLERLWVASAALAAPGRYVRAAALDVLVALLDEGNEAVVPHVQRVAAAHAERFGPSLSAPEADRLRRLLASPPQAAAALDALLAVLSREAAAPSTAGRTSPDIAAMLPRARAVAEGAAPGPRPTAPRQQSLWLGLAIVHATQQRRGVEARSLLDELTAHIESGADIEGVHWTAIRAAATDSPERARRLAAACLARPGEAPSEGYLPVALTLASIGATTEVATALQRAMRRREPGAKAQLAKHLRHLGWQASEAGRRQEAIRYLREAKRLAS